MIFLQLCELISMKMKILMEDINGVKWPIDLKKLPKNFSYRKEWKVPMLDVAVWFDQTVEVEWRGTVL